MNSSRSLNSFFKKNLLAFILFIIFYTLFFNFIDLPCAKFMHSLSPQLFIYKFSFLIQKLFSPAHWLVLSCVFVLVGFGLFFNSKKTSSNTLFKNPKTYFHWGFAGILAFILAGICKVVLARYRPIEFFNLNLYGFHFFSDNYEFNSTPSGHTVMAFAVLGSIASSLKKMGGKLIGLSFVLILICLGIAGSRLILNAHYCSDLIFGMYVGLISAYWVKYLIK